MSADLLREAAALMRERAEAATPGQWQVDGPWYHDDDELGNIDETALVTVGEHRDAVVVGPPRDLNWLQDRRQENVVHIASWHPAVALAVADWLDAVVDEEWCCDECKYHPDNPNHVQHAAVAVARAYLGRDA